MVTPLTDTPLSELEVRFQVVAAFTEPAASMAATATQRREKQVERIVMVCAPRA
jgi:hypothetical protein